MERFEARRRGDSYVVSGVPGWAGFRFTVRLGEVDGRTEVVEYAVKQIDPAARLPREAPPLELIEVALGANRQRPATVEQLEADERRQVDTMLGQLESLHRLARQEPITRQRTPEFHRQVLDVIARAHMEGKREREALADFYGFGIERAKQVTRAARRALGEPYRNPGAAKQLPTTSTPIPWPEPGGATFHTYATAYGPVEVQQGMKPPFDYLDPAEQERIRRERRGNPRTTTEESA